MLERVTFFAAITLPVCRPTVAIVMSDEVQVATLVMLSVLPLLLVPVALYRRLVPCARVAAAGVMAIEVKFGGTTERAAVPVTLPFVAVIVTGLLVTATPVATKPLIATFVVSDEVHVTLVVMVSVEPSLKVPVAA